MHGHTNNKHSTVSKFNEFKPHLKSPKNQFQLSAGLNLKKTHTNSLSSDSDSDLKLSNQVKNIPLNLSSSRIKTLRLINKSVYNNLLQRLLLFIHINTYIQMSGIRYLIQYMYNGKIHLKVYTIIFISMYIYTLTSPLQFKLNPSLQSRSLYFIKVR